MSLVEEQGLRVAVEGCGHGTLDAIYASVDKSCQVRGWDRVDLLIIGGDFQAVRNAADLTVMSCPVKYRAIGDFYRYYDGTTVAPYLTIFVGGNHEASSHLWELYYGGWVAPNIYYMGAASVVRVNGVRIAGMSGIWKGYNYNKHHHERLPYNQDDVKSIYHVREIDIRKLLQLQSQIDVAISHDWPRTIEKHGNSKSLWKMKPDFEQESKDGTLGNQAATHVMDRLRPPYWFAAHLHCKYAATKTYEDKVDEAKSSNGTMPVTTTKPGPIDGAPTSIYHNNDAIDLDMDEDDVAAQKPVAMNGAAIVTKNQDEIDLDDEDEEESASKPPQTLPTPNTTLAVMNQDEINLDDEEDSNVKPPPTSTVPADVRAQLPAAFARPTPSQRRTQPGLPSPPGVTNKTVRFLALDKCLPGRKFLQLLEVPSHNASIIEASTPEQKARPKPKFEYDPEWLAITRVFAPDLVLGNKVAPTKHDQGEDHYRPLIAKEQEWVTENIVKKGKLEIPENFVVTAPIFHEGMPEIIQESPAEYNNPQMQTFCDLVEIENKFFATEEEKVQRFRNGPAPAESRQGGRGGGRGRGGRGGGNRGGRGRGRGRW